MIRSPEQLRRDALQIWRAGVDAVRADRLVRRRLRVEGRELLIGDDRIDLDRVARIAVVGAGKAGAGMAAAVEEVLGPDLLQRKQVTGWVNVPEDCVRPLARIHLHAARPPGVNEPTPAGVRGAEEILRIVASLGPDDLCLCLLSGGGSALLPAPVEAITLEDKLALTRHLSAAGANIKELNAVRKQLSRIKGGGLARACRAGRLASLIISDVLGDPLDTIASGPTTPDSSTPEAALEILDRFGAREAGVSSRVFEFLDGKAEGGSGKAEGGKLKAETETPAPPSAFGFPLCVVTNHVIGNNAAAVDAAAREAERLGYSPAVDGDCPDFRGAARENGTVPFASEGPAEDVGRHLAAMAVRMRDEPGPDCLVSGGEPVVRLVEASRRGLGGRNQQLVLAALEYLAADGASGIALLSGGTDGEDGPTDAAGAFFDAQILAAALASGSRPGGRPDWADFLARNDAYHFFEPLGALLKTGPTQTNVFDLRVIVVDLARRK